MRKLIYFLLPVLTLAGCSQGNGDADAYGNFEAIEYVISAEGNGPLQLFSIEEGQSLSKGVMVGVIDTVQLDLKRQQMIAQRRLTANKLATIQAQVGVQMEQKKNLQRDIERIGNMLADGAAPQKQLDDLQGNLNVVESQILSINTQKQTVSDELLITDKQLLQLDDQINRCYIRNPMQGTVLEKYAEQYEMVTTGKPLYKIADLNSLDLRVYVGEDQLSKIKIGQEVDVLYDAGEKQLGRTRGVVGWVSAKAEFTPKIIQTRDERVNLVYALKVRVKNEGAIKIGMPGEIMMVHSK
jgi:HlyD family secretion protein